MIAVFSGTPRDGHGQHQASGILAREAFTASGDRSRFPDQLERGLRPHQPELLFQALWRGGADAPIRLSTGDLDPLLGRSHFQVAMASRSLHRSQDMGRGEPLGPQVTRLAVVAGDADVARASLFAGVDTTLSAQARALGGAASGAEALTALLAEYESRAVAVRERYNPLRSRELVEPLTAMLALLARADALASESSTASAERLRFRMADEREELHDALRLAAGLVLDATVDDERVVPGQEFTLRLALWNGGVREVRVDALEPVLPRGWTAVPLDTTAADAVLPAGQLATRRFTVRVAPDAELSEPYFLRQPRAGDLYRWPDEAALRGRPFEPPALLARADVALGEARVPLEVEATFPDVDKAVGERRRPLLVVPAVSLTVDPSVAVLPLDDTGLANGVAPGADNGAAARAIRLRVRLRSEAPATVTGRIEVRAPGGWSAEVEDALVRLAKPGAEASVPVGIIPPAEVAPGRYRVAVELVTAAGARYGRGFTLVDYPHVRPRPLYRDAATTISAFPVAIAPDLLVGYVTGAGDDGAAALGQVGARVELIEQGALESADLARYDAVVLGIRAYEVRADLATQTERLIDYARRGGTVIVQYNKYEYPDGGFPPYPLDMARPHGRVTDEAAPVRLLDVQHPLLSWPNRIGPADFDGWVHERGLYFASEWDDRYQPLLEMSDPGEEPQRGALLAARVGDGWYVYTGLALFRQWPEAVPGAYRLLANLVSLGARE